MPLSRRQRVAFLLGYAHARRELMRELRQSQDWFEDRVAASNSSARRR
jgi:hypothetical protein